MVLDGGGPDTQPLQTASEPADGWVLGGRYRVLERAGSGGMAEVFKAHDDLLNRDVAVKVFRNVPDDLDGTTNGAARRELELHSLAQLNHPHLITLFDGSVTGDGPGYLVLEFVSGPDLASRLRAGPLPEQEAREVGAQIADALAYVHAHGMVHRDVKPANILLGVEDAPTGPGRLRARLSDFGIVRLVDSPQVTSVDLTVGTAYYIAPEQARGSSVGPEADVYALALVLLEALTGRRAFGGPMHEALAARLNADPYIPPELPEPWPALLTAMTAQDPAARPDAAEVARQLRSAGGTAAFPVAGAAQAPAAALASATAATTSMPAAGTVAAMAAPAVAEAVSGPVPVRHGRRGRLGAGLALAAVVLAAAVALGAFLLDGRAADSPVGGTSTSPTMTTHHRPPSTSAKPSATAAAQINTEPAVQRSTSKPVLSRSATPTKKSAVAPPPPRSSRTTSAPAPTTSAAPSSSSVAPSTSSSSASTNATTATTEAVPAEP